MRSMQKNNARSDTVGKLETAYLQAIRETDSYDVEPPERKREQLIGALHVVSDKMIAELYDTVLLALDEDMKARYRTGDPTGPDARAAKILADARIAAEQLRTPPRRGRGA